MPVSPLRSRHLLPVLLVTAAHAGLLAHLPASPAPAAPLPAATPLQLLAPAPASPPPAPVLPTPPRPRPPVEAKPVPQAQPQSEAVREPEARPEPVPALPPAPAPAAPVPAPATAPAAAPAPAAAVTPPRLDASYRGNPPPAYPLASRRHHETGTVRLRLLVQADGQVGAVEVLRSSGFPRLDQAAVAAVRQWRLLPARRGETAVAAWYELPLTFQLEN